jgi:hypothetical protein
MLRSIVMFALAAVSIQAERVLDLTPKTGSDPGPTRIHQLRKLRRISVALA